MENKKAFTLIELVSVLVILAILALIVTPLVLNIIRKARVSADKRSIDAYGRTIELAIADYLLENGTFPTSIEELTIEYSGDRVVCSTTQLNSDSSVYLADCTVGNRAVAGYIYGKEEVITYKAYEIGDEVTYNNVNYYVIANSDATESSVTLLKAEPLTTEEVNTYGGVGTANNHVNMYVTSNTSDSYYQQAYDHNGYGGMAYYSSPTCGYNGSEWLESECLTDYEQSEIKYVVDAWKEAKAPLASEVRLIKKEELEENIGFEEYDPCGGCGAKAFKLKLPFAYNSSYWYWTMSRSEEDLKIFVVSPTGMLDYQVVISLSVSGNYLPGAIRPVITISKSALN